MDITAKLKYLRVSPRKARLVADVVRGMDAERARAELRFSDKRVSEPILKLLDSAIANGKNNFSKTGGLYIREIFVDQGPTYKRMRASAKGRSLPIGKKTSHITIVLDEKK
jgi:large subunit ribosomal protein L22